MELLRAANRAKEQGTILIPFELYLKVFFVDEGNFWQPDWFLANDLLLIAIIEQLSQNAIDINRDLVEQADKELSDSNEN
jgi:hypothetical protein